MRCTVGTWTSITDNVELGVRQLNGSEGVGGLLQELSQELAQRLAARSQAAVFLDDQNNINAAGFNRSGLTNAEGLSGLVVALIAIFWHTDRDSGQLASVLIRLGDLAEVGLIQ